jgi:hypothetical protein
MPDGDPFRLLVLQALTSRLQEITPANGYRFDVSSAVFRGRARYGDNDPENMLSILEDPRDTENDDASGASSATIGKWKLLVQGFVEDDQVNPLDPAYRLSADVRKRLSQIRVTEARNLLGFGGRAPCVVDIHIGSPIHRPADEFSLKAYFWIPLTLELAELGDA